MSQSMRQGLVELYADLDREIAAAGPVCLASGRCCRFTEYGHTLFMSEDEAELLLEPGLPEGAAINRDSCPYQVGGLCTARERRPMGCRIYYCDPKYGDKQFEISERYIRRLKQMTDHADRPWRYQPLHRFLEERFIEGSPAPAAGRLDMLGDGA